MDGRPLVRGIKRAAAASFLASLQSAIDDSWMLHPCFNVEGVFDPSERGVPASNLPPREVIYWGLEFTGKLTIPEWSCHHLGCSSPDQSITPHALTFCCFPSTPSFPSVWFDLSVMHTYKRLGPKEGLSATGFLDALERVQAEHDLGSKALKARFFENAFCAFLDMEVPTGSLGPEGLDVAPKAAVTGEGAGGGAGGGGAAGGGRPGIFDDCPICSDKAVPYGEPIGRADMKLFYTVSSRPVCHHPLLPPTPKKQ